MGNAVRPVSTTPPSWDPFSNIDAVVEEVLAEQTANATGGPRPVCPDPKDPLTGAALRKAIMAIWCV